MIVIVLSLFVWNYDQKKNGPDLVIARRENHNNLGIEKIEA